MCSREFEEGEINSHDENEYLTDQQADSVVTITLPLTNKKGRLY